MVHEVPVIQNQTDFPDIPVSARMAIVIPTARWTPMARSVIGAMIGVANEEICVLIADNSENEEKREFLKKIRNINPNVLAVSHAKNIGAQNNFFYLYDWSRHIEFLAQMADDDWMSPSYFSDAYQILRDNPQISCAEVGTTLVDMGDSRLINVSQSSMCGRTPLERMQKWNGIVARVTMYNASRRSTLDAAIRYLRESPLPGITLAEDLWELNRLALGDFLASSGHGCLVHYPQYGSIKGDRNRRFYELLCRDVGLSYPAVFFMGLSTAVQCAIFLMGNMSPISDPRQRRVCAQHVFEHVFRQGFLPTLSAAMEQPEVVGVLKRHPKILEGLQKHCVPSAIFKPELNHEIFDLFLCIIKALESNPAPGEMRLSQRFQQFADACEWSTVLDGDSLSTLVHGNLSSVQVFGGTSSIDPELHQLLQFDSPLKSNHEYSCPIAEQATNVGAAFKQHNLTLGIPLRVAVYSLEPMCVVNPQVRFFQSLGAHNGVELIWAVTDKGDGDGWTADTDLEADIYVISRLFPAQNTQAVVNAVFAKCKPVLYEIDELLIDPPPDSRYVAECAEKKPFIEAVIRQAHGIVVPTSELAMRLSVFNRNVSVLPNQVSYARFYQPPPNNGREVRIALVGTSASGNDFALVDEALRHICRKFGKRVRLFFVGSLPESWKGHANAELVDFLPEYAAFIARMKGLRLDIGIVPLVDNAFNACKSPLKWFEFSALGMAGVFSFTPAYKQVVSQGETGLLVDNQTEKWVAALSLLIEYPEKRLEIAFASQREVLKAHAVEADAGKAETFYRRLAMRLLTPEASSLEALESEGTSEVDPSEALYKFWKMGHTQQYWDMTWIAERIKTWIDTDTRPPVFHWCVVCPLGHEGKLARNIRDLHAQFYQSWRLTVVAEVPAPAELSSLDRVEWRTTVAKNAISELNMALQASNADFVGMIEAGDGLPPHTTFALARHLMQNPDWVAVFSDEDRLDEAGERHTPYFKPALCPHRLRSAPFSLGGLFLLSRSVFTAHKGFDPSFEGVETWDLALRLLESYAPTSIGHVADVLCHREEAASRTSKSGNSLVQVAEASLRAHLARLNWQGEVQAGLLPGCFELRPAVFGQPLVSILIPVGQDVSKLQLNLPVLIENTAYSHCEVLLLSGPDSPPAMREYLAELAALGSSSLLVMSMPTSVTWAQFDAAAQQAKGDYLLFLDPALQVMHSDWLEVMLGFAQGPETGAVGARLVNDQNTLTHAGWVLGLNGMALGDAGFDQSAEEPGYFGRFMLPQTCSALDGGCLLVKRMQYVDVGGLGDAGNDEKLDKAFGEGKSAPRAELIWADFCLRIQAQGLRNLWTPHATLIDKRETDSESFVRSSDKTKQEEGYRKNMRVVETLVDKWSSEFADDPAYNRNLSLMLPFQTEHTPILTMDKSWRPAPRVLSLHADVMGCGEYRIMAPMRAMQRFGKIMGWDCGGYFHPREYARMDVESMVMQRQLAWGQIELIERITRISKAFRVYELDDLITNLPILNSQKKVFIEQKDLNKRLRKALSMFHRFVVSTEFLAETYKDYCDELVVVPNYLERLRWDGFAPQRRIGKKTRVGWAGSSTHAGDLRLIVDVVKETANEVDWVFFGMCPDSIRHLVKEFHEPVKLANYAEKLAGLNLDLAIAPLEDVPFNHGKSHLRLLEYGVLGFPVICTDITPYRGEFPVTRVPNKFKAWVEAIRSHVSDPDELARRGDALRDHVQANWMLEDNLDVWLRAWLPR